ncbi:hypothetical protein Clacol_003545 [Clathrus columnatus]|uniref:Uncharacterized protein n=1 Tax=Clathrus columnatus TaxID=1419009 RepID=A0AAV5A7Y6_9AGAM|nr:hypothetical protein Clacol_003545 [Clathrus columnatus]
MFSQPLLKPSSSQNIFCQGLRQQIRFVSSSPYGRTHVWKRRRPKLPNPIVPIFPQQVIQSDGSTFTHYITSPRSTIRLTRDLTNNPLWNYGASGGKFEDEQGSAGRMGRFRRKFEEFSGNVDWVVDESGTIPSDISSSVVDTMPKQKGKSKSK